MEPTIETYTGKMFNFLSVKQEDIDIEDIAHSLSLQCRYTGHCKQFLSVAEHSVAVADHLLKTEKDRTLALAGLLHDAAEAYLSDLASPLKSHIQGYDLLENNVNTAIGLKYNIDISDPRVKKADITMLSQESYQLLPSKGGTWNWEYYGGRPEFVEPVACLPPKLAKDLFLAWFKQLTNEPQIIRFQDVVNA